MPRILVLDDSREKASAVRSALESLEGVDCKVDFASSIQEAKRFLISAPPELLILDLYVPDSFDRNSVREGGVAFAEFLVRQSANNGRYAMPPNVVALTAFDDIAKDMGARLLNLGIPCLTYDDRSDDWACFLRGLVRRISAIHTSSSSTPKKHCVLICATPRELRQLRAVFSASRQIGVLDGHTWWESQHIRADSTVVELAFAMAPTMGMPAAAVLTRSAITTWAPRMVIMVGICAGVEGTAAIGDLIVADPVWDAGSGKIRQDGSLWPDPQPLRVDPTLRSELYDLSLRQDVLEKIRSDWSADPPRTIPSMHIGPAVSTASVVCDSTTVCDIKEHARKLLGLDMEAYGFMYALASTSGVAGTVLGCSMKTVVDYASASKGDEFQSYGCYFSASVCKELIDRVPRALLGID